MSSSATPTPLSPAQVPGLDVRVSPGPTAPSPPLRGFIPPPTALMTSVVALIVFGFSANLIREGLCLACVGRSLDLVPFALAGLLLPLGRTYRIQSTGECVEASVGYAHVPLKTFRVGPMSRVSVEEGHGRPATVVIVDPDGGLPVFVAAGAAAARVAADVEARLAALDSPSKPRG